MIRHKVILDDIFVNEIIKALKEGKYEVTEFTEEKSFEYHPTRFHITGPKTYTSRGFVKTEKFGHIEFSFEGTKL